MTSARGAYAGGRQVQDRSYFLSELRQKARDVLATVESMQADLDGAGRGQEADLERVRADPLTDPPRTPTDTQRTTLPADTR